MVTVNPFRGLRFDPDVIGDPGRVLVPPYDSISSLARDDFEACSAYNMVRLILDPAGRYDHAAKLLESWIDEGALRPEAVPSLYVYEQSSVPGLRGGCHGTAAEASIRHAGGGRSDGMRLQRGLLASVPLDRSRTWVLPHERTMPAPVADRLRLLTATKTDLSPIFGLYGFGDYVLVAGHLLLRGLAHYEQFRDGRERDEGAVDTRARDLYDQLGLPTLPWSRSMKHQA